MDRGKNHRSAARPNSSGVGFLLLDDPLEPIYANDEAVQILAYPKGPREIGSLDGFLAEKIQSALFDGHSSPQSSPPTEFLSGRRHYRCRVFSLDSHSSDPAQATAVLFERSPREAIDMAHIAAAFHLTEREQETVGFLVEGLTSKQIAKRMNISPNTVKAFIRLIMIKLGVSTRAGVIAKIIKTIP